VSRIDGKIRTMLSSNQIRSKFLEYFRERGHTVVASSPLVPANDRTLLFTNAGMVQFKDVFLGRESRDYSRAASSQRCVRAGGKHNDLENVGYTARHHTFFEMLGNFSFGDYFKREAIHFAWEFLTRDLGLPPEKLWVTVFEEDQEAEDIWLEDVGVDARRFSRIGAHDNFWQMGDTGPCGPCSEIFYDHGPEIAGGPPGTPEEDGDRFIEIWNLVFMQYDRSDDGTLTPLPKPSVDTGMGLERIAAVLQGVHDNYDIDLFRNLMRAGGEVTGTSDTHSNSLKVIADHIRATAFLITDGVLPSNEGRGYVLRRILRRAVRHGYNLGCRDPFFHKLVAPLVEEMGAAYPELVRSRAQVERVIEQEEVRFAETLEQGMRLLESALSGLEGPELGGDTVFKLYDTYGFPVDLTADVARERGLSVDLEGFEREMEAQRQRARAASAFSADYSHAPDVAEDTRFTGYEHLRDHGQVVALMRDGNTVDQVSAGEQAQVVLDRTPFYAESGGQVGDRGILTNEGAAALFEVDDTQSLPSGAHVHIGRMKKGVIRVGQTLTAQVDEHARRATMRNHSATHLLHAALKRVLGEHVVQKGSLVAPDRLRFDFAHYEPMTAEQLREVERLVNDRVLENIDAEVLETSYDDALRRGAIALFGEKYGERVRMLRMGDFSVELCGGTHVARTGDIGLFKIISETGISAGVRRIEALTGAGALAWVNEQEERLRELAALMRTGHEDVVERTRQALERLRGLEKEVDRLNSRLASTRGGELAEQARTVAGIKVLTSRLDGADARTLRNTTDQLKQKLGSSVVVLASVDGGKVSLVAGVTKDLTASAPAGELVNFVASQVGGRGGGRPDMAQAGGNRPEQLDDAMASVDEWVSERLAAADA